MRVVLLLSNNLWINTKFTTQKVFFTAVLKETVRTVSVCVCVCVFRGCLGIPGGFRHFPFPLRMSQTLFHETRATANSATSTNVISP